MIYWYGKIKAKNHLSHTVNVAGMVTEAPVTDYTNHPLQLMFETLSVLGVKLLCCMCNDPASSTHVV